MSSDPSMDQFWKQVKAQGSPFLPDAWRTQHIDYNSMAAGSMNPLAPEPSVGMGIPTPQDTQRIFDILLAPHRAFWRGQR